MSKLLVKKDFELITLLDEKEIQKLIDTKQNVRVGYIYQSLTHSNSGVLIEEGRTNLSILTDWIPLNQTDIFLVYAQSGFDGDTIYAKDNTAILASLRDTVSMNSGTWGVLVYIDALADWVLYPITREQLSTTRVRHPGALSNLGTDAGATQSSINSSINSKFGALESNTVTVTVTYTDNSTETVTLYKQAPQQQS